MNIVGINKKLLDYQIDLVSSRGCCDTVDFQEELQFVLNMLEQAERTLTYYAEEPYLTSIGYATQAVEALQAIRKGD